MWTNTIALRGMFVLLEHLGKEKGCHPSTAQFSSS